MVKLDEIKDSIGEHFENYERILSDFIKSEVPLLDKIFEYLNKDKGKQVRPMLVILSAAVSGTVKDSTYRAAAMVELLHTASLLHDDVVDNSRERRGGNTVNATWNNKIAILTGDYLVSKGMLLGIKNNDINIIPFFIRAGYEMSEGELLQLEKSLLMDITEDVYFEIIRKKTGSLMGACCAAGSTSGGADNNIVNMLYEFGENVGIAFQIKDDILDYEKNINAGKPSGTDIKEQKFTLPLIYMLNNISPIERDNILNVLKSKKSEKIEKVIDIVNNSDGIAYSKRQIEHYQNKALNILEKYFENNEYRQLLEELVLYNTVRYH